MCSGDAIAPDPRHVCYSMDTWIHVSMSSMVHVYINELRTTVPGTAALTTMNRAKSAKEASLSVLPLVPKRCAEWYGIRHPPSHRG